MSPNVSRAITFAMMALLPQLNLAASSASLNFQSTKSHVIPTGLPNHAVNINIGGTAGHAAPSTLWTRAEMVAITKILRGGDQSVSGSGLPTITSLDLTNPAVVSQLVQLQDESNSPIGGTLQVTDGVATGGTLVIPSTISLAHLTAEDIPKGVTLTLQNFQSTNPIDINLTSASHTSQVIINGTEQFVSNTSTPSSGHITITSSLSGVVLAINGLLTSDGSLSIRANGSMTINGQLSTAHSASIYLTGGTGSNVSLIIGSGGSLSLNGGGTNSGGTSGIGTNGGTTNGGGNNGHSGHSDNGIGNGFTNNGVGAGGNGGQNNFNGNSDSIIATDTTHTHPQGGTHTNQNDGNDVVSTDNGGVHSASNSETHEHVSIDTGDMIVDAAIDATDKP